MYSNTFHRRPRTYGVRFSGSDAFALALFAGFAFWLRSQAIPLWWIAPFVVMHFFLFCNIFRVHRRLEIIWAIVFIVLVCTSAAVGRLTFPFICAVQVPVTVFLLATELRTPRYHGILARRINADLDDYLSGKY